MGFTVRQQLQDFPVRQMVVVSLIGFSEPLVFTSLFPYLYFMIRDFQIAKNEKDIPKFSGSLAASFAFFQFLFAVRWGLLADKIGRKPVLLIGLTGTSITLILFGLSQNFYWALFSRSFSGCLNGNIAVLRTTVGEIAHQKRHQPIAFSSLPLLFNFGTVVGPMIGGYFAHPKEKNPYEEFGEITGNSILTTVLSVFGFGSAKNTVSNGFSDVSSVSYVSSTFDSTFAMAKHSSTFISSISEKFPYLISNLVVAGFIWFSLTCGILFLEETHEVFKYRRDIGVDFGDYLLTKAGFPCPVRPWNRKKRGNTETLNTESLVEDTERTPLINDNSTEYDSNDDASIASSVSTSHNDPIGYRVEEAVANVILRTYSKDDDAVHDVNADRINQNYKVDYSNAFTPQVIKVITGNCILSLHYITYSEFLPVFLAGNFKPDRLKFPFKIVGGFGWGTSSIGNLWSSTGILGIFIILLIFPLIEQKLGAVKGYRCSVSILPFVYFIVPLTIFTVHQYNDFFPTWFSTVFLYSLTSLTTLATATALPQINILNHRAAAPQHRTYVNSSTMSCLAFARFVGPLVFGLIMSVGEKHEIGWLTWWLMSLLAMGGMVQLYWLLEYED